MFQSRCSVFCAEVSVEVAVGAGDEVVVDAYRTREVFEGLKATWRLTSWTLRLGAVAVGVELELCFLRSEGVVVVYVQGVKSVGCNLQPIAAVRRVGVAPSILYRVCWWLSGDLRQVGARGEVILSS